MFLPPLTNGNMFWVIMDSVAKFPECWVVIIHIDLHRWKSIINYHQSRRVRGVAHVKRIKSLKDICNKIPQSQCHWFGSSLRKTSADDFHCVWLWSHGVVINDDIIGNFKVSTHLVIAPAKVGISAHLFLSVVVQKHYHNIHEKERQHYI